MKNLIFILFLSFSFIQAQNTRVIYQYTFRPDSTKVDSLKKEWMYLDINKDKSVYYSKDKFDSDSITADLLKKQLARKSGNISISQSRSTGDVGYSVEKIYPDYQIFLDTSIDSDKYRVLEDRKLSWKILADRDKIETYTVQKATTDYAGRHWTAWFTTEIPIQDGPYKFCGLPGLILKIEDATKRHLMVMKGIKKFEKIETEEVKSDKIPAFYSRKTLDVSRKQYLAQLKKYRKDPVQGMREMLNIPNAKVTITVNGQEYSDPKNVLREMEKAARQQLEEDNNQIELNP